MRSTIIAVLGLMAAPALGQVRVAFEPDRLAAGVSTDLVISLLNEGAADLSISGVLFAFTGPPEVSLEAFRWLSGFDDASWVHTETLPEPQTAAAGFGVGIVVEAGSSLDVGVVTLTASGAAADMTIDLTVFADDADSVFEGDGLAPVEIVGGASVTLTVDSGDEGMAPPGGGGDGGSGGDNGDEGDTDDDPDGMDDDPGSDDGGGGLDGDPGDGGDVDVDEGGTGDDSAGNDNGEGGVVDVDGGSDGNGAGGGGSMDGGSNGGNGMVSPMGLCGMAMAPYALFTLAILSVMKTSDRRRV